jgi:hypothetical protein
VLSSGISRPAQAREEARLAVEQSLNDTCTFRPAVSPTPLAGHKSIYMDPDHLVQRIEEEKKVKEMRLEQTRQSLEHEELKSCTFAPAVSKCAWPLTRSRSGAPVADARFACREPPASAGPIVVRGMGRYLELKDLARRQAEELREREKKAPTPSLSLCCPIVVV